ncbi:PAS domain-containing protein [Terribacillus sp. 179-K 1B1 HS]
MSSSPIPHCQITPVIYTNKAVEQITGYKTKGIIGQNCRFLQGEKRQKKM